MSGDGRTPEEIEREIKATRRRMSRDIDELGERLSPGRLKRQARQAISDKALEVASNVGDRARDSGSRMKDFIQENPSLVAAMGLGTVWLIRQRPRSKISGKRMARFAAVAAGVTVLGLATGLLVPETDRERRVRGSVRDDLAERARHTAGRVKQAAVEAGSELKSAFNDAAESVTRQVKESARRVKEQAKQAVREPSAGRRPTA